MKQLMFPGWYSWDIFDQERQLDFNGLLWVRPEGNILIDPPPPSAADLAQIEKLGGAKLCVLTNSDHRRDTEALHQRFGFAIAAHAADVGALSLPVTRTLKDGDEVVPGMQVIHLADGKTPGEIALFLPQWALLLVGDILRGTPMGSVSMLPNAKLRDPAKAALELRKLLRLKFEHLLVGDGDSLFHGAREAVVRCLEARSDVELHRVNPDELAWSEVTYDGRYPHEIKDLSAVVGARKLSYNLRRLPPGGSSGPTHYHQLEEELFIVLEGRCALQTPKGVTPLRQGDVLSCPPGEPGTHSLYNDSDAPCVVLCLSDVVPHDHALQTGLVDFRTDRVTP